MTARFDDWEDRLNDFLASNMDRPFEWGQWDCALFATACAAEITGEDRAAAFRGQYSDRIGSARALREIGKGTLIKTMDGLYRRKPVSMAHRGDIIMAGASMGISSGQSGWFVGEEQLAAASGLTMREGLVRIPRHLWTRAWEV